MVDTASRRVPSGTEHWIISEHSSTICTAPRRNASTPRGTAPPTRPPPTGWTGWSVRSGVPSATTRSTSGRASTEATGARGTRPVDSSSDRTDGPCGQAVRPCPADEPAWLPVVTEP